MTKINGWGFVHSTGRLSFTNSFTYSVSRETGCLLLKGPVHY